MQRSLAPQALQLLVSGLVVVLCLCVTHNCAVQARTLLDESQQQDEQPQEAEFSDSPDVSEDFWPILCPKNNWFSQQKDQCMECSWCPQDQYITRPCYRFQDTQCSPLVDLPGLDKQPLTRAEDFENLRNSGGRGHGHDKELFGPAAIVLSVIVGVLVLAFLVTLVATCILWRRQETEEPPQSKPTEKLICSYSPAPSETV